MILAFLEWGTVALGVVMTILVSYALVQTARHPTAWANRMVVASLPDEPFIVHGDDTVGLF